MTKRILHIIHTLNPESGGPATSIRTLSQLAPGSDEANIEVVTLDHPESPSLLNYDFPVIGLGPGFGTYGYSPRLMPWFRSNAHRFDGVIVHGLWQYCGLAAWRAFQGRIPYMVLVHGMLDPYFKRAYPLKHAKKWLYWLFAEYWILRSAYRVLFTSVAEARLARESFWLCRWNSEVIQYGAALPPDIDCSRKEDFFTSFPHLARRRFLLFLGRIDRKKGCDLLIQAFINTAALDPNLDLVIAGPDPHNWRLELEAALTEANLNTCVHWTGMLTGDAKWGAFYACEAFILPSHQENFGIAVAEALACGKPALLSERVNIAADIEADGAGLMEPDTLAGTERLLKNWIAKSGHEKRCMAEQAARTFALRYDMRTNARDIARLFERANRRSEMARAVTAQASD